MTAEVKGFLTFLSDAFRDRAMLWRLARNDLKAKFASSFLGILWAFLQPLVTILVFWFVFEAGFKNPPVHDAPFVIWFIPAYLAWSFFSEALISGTNCLMEYSYLVKKVNFRVSVIPVVKILSSAFVHLGFLGFLLLMLFLYERPFTLHQLQAVYYFFCLCFLLLGLCWLLAAVAPFVKDTTNIVNVAIQIGFWMTPIFWDPDAMDPFVRAVLKLNPMFYICRGYRDSFIDCVWVWQRGYTNLFFWVEAVSLFALGAYLFKKLRPQFADVL